MKVYVVTVNSWNGCDGEYSSDNVSVHSVFSTKSEAENFISVKNEEYEVK